MDITGIMQSHIIYLLGASGALESFSEAARISIHEAEKGLRQLLDDGTTFEIGAKNSCQAVKVFVGAHIAGPGSGWYVASGDMSVCGEGAGLRARVALTLCEEARISPWEMGSRVRPRA